MWQFIGGFVTCFALFALHFAIRVLLDLRSARRARRAIEALTDEDPRDVEAKKRVQACKSRLRWRREINPDWISPLSKEVPGLVQDIAAAYYPDAKDAEAALLAPGLNHFVRAVKLSAEDILEILESRYLGRLVNVSAGRAVSLYRLGRTVAENPATRWITRWTRRITPVLQVARYRSPLMWGSLVANNVAFRLVQPAIVDLISRRVIELYSGRLLEESVEEVAERNLEEAEREANGQSDEVRESV